MTLRDLSGMLPH